MKPYIFLILLLTACRKNDVHSISNGTYTTNGTGTFKPAVMYVKGAVITDTAIISQYLAGAFESSRFAASITINGNTAFEDSTKTTYSVTHQSGNIFLLTGKDSVALTPSYSGTLGCDNVFNRIRKNPPDFICMDITYVGGGYRRCMGLPKIPVESNGSSIDIPLINFYFKAMRTNRYCSYASTLTDYFDTNGVSDIEENDTLVVQTGYISLIKQ